MTNMSLAPSLPSDVELEQGIIGGLLMDNGLIDSVFGICGSNDFYHAPHPALAEAIIALRADGMTVHPLTLKAKVGTILDEIGGLTYLAGLAAAAPAAGYLHMARQLKDLRIRREAMTACMDGIEALACLDVPVLTAMRGAVEAAERASVEFGASRHVATPDQIDSVLKAAEDASQGRAAPFVTTGLPALDEALGGLQEADFCVYAGRPGMGKAQPLDSKVLLRNGSWKCIGDLQLRDELASVDGSRSVVSGIFPRGHREIFNIRFSDGRETRACGEHLWEVMYREWKQPRVLDTARIRQMLTRKRYQHRLFIRKISGHFGCDIDLPIDPYVLGVLLGDGGITTNSNVITTADEEVAEAVGSRIPSPLVIRKRGGSAKYDYAITMAPGSFVGIAPADRRNFLTEALKDLGVHGKLSQHKFVPPRYMEASREQRLQLLRGLMDTDGWAEKLGTVRFCTTSEQLAHDVQYLVRSLGGLCSIATRQTHAYGNGGRKAGLRSYVCRIRHELGDSLFGLTRKKERAMRGRNSSISLSFDAIEPAGIEETACIRVTHPTNLYITDCFITTHNTSMLLRTALAAAMAGRPAIVFSLEMTAAQCLHRIGTDIDFDVNPLHPLSYSWFRRKPRYDDVGRLAEALRQVPVHLEIRDHGDLTIHDIAAISGAFAARHAGALGIVVIDYLQKVAPTDRYRGSKVQEVTEISGAAKALAKRLGWPVVAGAQLSRGVEGREDKRPTLSDLRESGAIEQDADSVIGLFRPAYYIDKRKPGTVYDPKYPEWESEHEEHKNVLEALILKNRHGAEDVLSLFCEMRASAIRDREPDGVR